MSDWFWRILIVTSCIGCSIQADDRHEIAILVAFSAVVLLSQAAALLFYRIAYR